MWNVLFIFYNSTLKGTKHATFEKNRIADSKMTKLRKQLFNPQ